MPNAAQVSRIAAPRIVGRYALFDQLAAGGMASVHIGRLLGPVGFSRTVAIKRLHEDLAKSTEFVVMFLDEVRIASRIRHPNVVTTLDVVAGERELLLVMEYVSGASLSRLLNMTTQSPQSLPPIPIVVDIMIGVLNGLHAAHVATNEKGTRLLLVHQDVSPQNILVGEDGIARVLDFGIAKAVGCLHATRPGEVMGKVRYMSPESIAQREVTYASDIYSASVVLWEALTGKRLFLGDNDAQIQRSILDGRSVPPSRLRSGIPRQLDEIVMRGLHRSPERRFGSAAAMARELEDAVTPVTRSAVADWVTERAGDEIYARDRYIACVEREFGSISRIATAPEAGELLDVFDDDTVAGDAWVGISASVTRVVPSRRVKASPLERRWIRSSWFALLVAVATACLVATIAFGFAQVRSVPTAGREPDALPVSIVHQATVVPIASGGASESLPEVVPVEALPEVSHGNGVMGAASKMPPSFSVRGVGPKRTSSPARPRGSADRLYRRD
jgi:eukaryotic-like serine/threonine-protein kinase